MAFYRLYKNYTHYSTWMQEFDEIMRPEIYAAYRLQMQKSLNEFSRGMTKMYAVMGMFSDSPFFNIY